MSIKRFNADVRAAIAKVKETQSFDVTSVSRGDSDGEFTATYRHPALPSPLEIKFLAEGTPLLIYPRQPPASPFFFFFRMGTNIMVQMLQNIQMGTISWSSPTVKMLRLMLLRL